jgi:DNA repair protein RecN (Recombination protein N)
MLRTLSIRDVVLIGRLDLSFQEGLCVLTGETGAGKSILLDALGLALGARAESRLVRQGAPQAAVTAVFDIPSNHEVYVRLESHGVEVEDDELILRRVLTADGKSRAFINDQRISVSLLKEVSELLAEIHGQFESQRLLSPQAHRGLLDSYGALDRELNSTRECWIAWENAVRLLTEETNRLAEARRDEDYLRHAVGEFDALEPKAGEEEELAQQRALMMHGEVVLEGMRQASEELSAGRGVEESILGAVRHLELISSKADGKLDETIAALVRAASETAEGIALLDRAGGEVDLDPSRLEAVEERLFALRALARKHNIDVDQLPNLHAEMVQKLDALDEGGVALAHYENQAADARAEYLKSAKMLTETRQKAAIKLDAAIAIELIPLKLDRALFQTQLEFLDEKDWGEAGCERVAFQVATNPGSSPGPLNKIASGGELARFMLALKVVLAKSDQIPTIVFDEVDAGVGGAVAAAVGERLEALAKEVQVLVVTHSPQVAARGAHHWQVSKTDSKSNVLTTVDALRGSDRTEEIARMLAGESVTDEARAAAESLMREH